MRCFNIARRLIASDRGSGFFTSLKCGMTRTKMIERRFQFPVLLLLLRTGRSGVSQGKV